MSFIAIKILFLKDDDDEINYNELVSNKNFSDEKNYKYSSGYTDSYKIKPLHIMLPKTSAYAKSDGDETKWMYFKMMAYDNWNKVTNGVEKEL